MRSIDEIPYREVVADLLAHMQAERLHVIDEIMRYKADGARHSEDIQSDGFVCNRLVSLLLMKDRLESEIEARRVELAKIDDVQPQSELSLAQHTERGLVRTRHPNRDFFVADLFDYALKDDGASMEAPIFTLSTKPDLSTWEWHSKDGDKSVEVTPSIRGRATQHDKDVLIFVVSQLTEGMNRDRKDACNRTVRFTVHDFLVTTNRDTSGHGYKLLQKAFRRLAGTRIYTNIKTGGQRVKNDFGIIDSWEIIEKSSTDERMIAVDVTLSKWLYNAVQAFEVLTIHPDYFRLRSPLARRLYEIARKHCGHQGQWAIGLGLLKEKAGSKSSLKEFRRAVQTVQAADSLPEYRLSLGINDQATFYTRNSQRFVRNMTTKLPGS